MNKILPVHHSIADWDWEQGATNRSLSATQKVSAPTSLRILKPTAGAFYEVILCRFADALLVPQGELRTWQYSSRNIFYFAVFRNQAALGTANYSNCYVWVLDATNATLYRMINGVSTTIGSVACPFTYPLWNHWRTVFWNGENLAGVPALCVNLYKEVTGAWVQQGATLYDTVNQWKDSAINRLGFRAYSENNYPEYWDDTEIWTPT